MEKNSPLKKHLNFPILLLSVVTLLQLKGLFGVQRVMPMLSRLLPPLVARYLVIPIVLVLPLLVFILWRDRFDKARSPRLFAGVLLIAGAACAALYTFDTAGLIVQQLTRGSIDLFKFAIERFDFCMRVMQLVLYLAAAIALLSNAKRFTLYRVICGLCVVVILFSSTAAIMYHRTDILTVLGYVLLPIALWFVPAVLQDKTSAEITNLRLGVVIVVAVIALCVFVAGGSPGGSSISSSGKQNTCGSCDRSWPAGDDGGNFMNIAKTGLCKNCENNYHSLKQYLDNED